MNSLGLDGVLLFGSNQKFFALSALWNSGNIQVTESYISTDYCAEFKPQNFHYS